MSIIDSIKSAFATAKEAFTLSVSSAENAENILIRGPVTDPTGNSGFSGITGPTGLAVPTGSTISAMPSTTTYDSLGPTPVSSSSASVSGAMMLTPVTALDLPYPVQVGTFMLVNDLPATIIAKTQPISASGPTIVCPVYWDGLCWRRFFN